MVFDEALNPYFRLVRAHPRIATDFHQISQDYFGKTTVLDLGCGNGHFLQEYLRQNPEMAGLGVERRFKRSFKTAEKFEALPGRVLQTEIEDFMEASPSNLWDEIWLQFPDPWPKARHEKKRMVSPDFFRNIRRLLKPRGRFCFRSDNRPYWEFFQMENIRQGLFPIVRSMKGNLFEGYPQTLYQKKFFNASIAIYSLEFRRLE